jgi:hypothetical protein
MPVKIVHPNHIEIMGFGKVLLATPSAITSAGDLHMGQIVEEAALTARAFAVIGKPTRDSSEIQETGPRDQDLRKAIEGFLVEDGIRYVLEFEGKVEPGVEVVTPGDKTCSESTLELVKLRLENAFPVTMRETQGEGQSNGLAGSYTRRDAGGEFLVETVRIVFGGEERQFSREKVISVISEIADLLNGRVGPSLAN